MFIFASWCPAVRQTFMVKICKLDIAEKEGEGGEGGGGVVRNSELNTLEHWLMFRFMTSFLKLGLVIASSELYNLVPVSVDRCPSIPFL